MGNQQSNELNYLKSLYEIEQRNYCKVWINKNNGAEQMEEYSVDLNDQQSRNKYEQMQTMRTKHPFFVNVMYFSAGQKIEMCGIYQKGCLLIQRIPYRLSYCEQIPLPEYLLIIKKSLYGYQKLSQIFGIFKINVNMIGFNKKWQLRIWIHTDFSSLYPQNRYCMQISEMLLSLIDSVQKSLNSPYSHNLFSTFVRQKKQYLKSFSDCIQGFDEYLRINSVYKIALNFRRIQRLAVIHDIFSIPSTMVITPKLQDLNFTKMSFKNLNTEPALSSVKPLSSRGSDQDSSNLTFQMISFPMQKQSQSTYRTTTAQTNPPVKTSELFKISSVRKAKPKIDRKNKFFPVSNGIKNDQKKFSLSLQKSRQIVKNNKSPNSLCAKCISPQTVFLYSNKKTFQSTSAFNVPVRFQSPTNHQQSLAIKQYYPVNNIYFENPVNKKISHKPNSVKQSTKQSGISEYYGSQPKRSVIFGLYG